MNHVRLIYYSAAQQLVAFSPKGALISVVERPTDEMIKKAKRSKDAFCQYAGPPLEDARVSITLRCNLNCNHCSVCAGKRVDLTFGFLGSLFSELHNMGVMSVTLSGGEPLMRRDLGSIVDIAHAEGLAININTNGTLISKGIVSKLKKSDVALVDVSLDGATPATHAILRGSRNSHDATLASLKLLSDRKLPVRISTVLHKAVLPELERILITASRLHIRRISLLELIPLGRATSTYSELAPTRTELWDALQEIIELRQKRGFDVEIEGYTVTAIHRGEQCTLPCQLQRYIRLDSFGDVRPYPTISLVVGNAKKTPLKAIWESSRMREAKQLAPPSICRFCGFTNWCCWYQKYSGCIAQPNSAESATIVKMVGRALN